MDEYNPNSILDTIKKTLGIMYDYEIFDPELIIHINSAFSILYELGVGPSIPYKITSRENTWDEFLEDNTQLENVKTYIYMKVRLVFDPPSNSFVVDAFEKQIQELEWRMNVAVETECLNGKG